MFYGWYIVAALVFISAYVQGIMVIGLVLGSPVAGFIFDYTGSYKWAWFLFGVIISFGLIILWTAPTRKEDLNLPQNISQPSSRE